VLKLYEQKTRMTSNSVEHITDMVMSELKSTNTTNNGSVEHLAGLVDWGREKFGDGRKNVSKEDVKKQVLKLEKDVHDLEQENTKLESYVHKYKKENHHLEVEKSRNKKQIHELEQTVSGFSKETRHLKDEKHANQLKHEQEVKHDHELLLHITKPDALQEMIDDLMKRLRRPSS
jgi:chromosome segregation ATPase